MKRGQVSVTYLGFFILLSFIFMGFVYGLSTGLERRSSEELGDQIMDNILTRVQKGITEIKVASNHSTDDVIVSKIELPRAISGDKYTIYSDEDYIYVKTLGQHSFLKRKEIYWWEINVTGVYHSSSNHLVLRYNRTDHRTLHIS